MWSSDDVEVSKYDTILHQIPLTLFHMARNKHANELVIPGLTRAYEVGFYKDKLSH